MRIKPAVMDRIQTTHTSYEVDFTLEANVTFIVGDSGTGKSAVFSFLRIRRSNAIIISTRKRAIKQPLRKQKAS